MARTFRSNAFHLLHVPHISTEHNHRPLGFCFAVPSVLNYVPFHIWQLTSFNSFKWHFSLVTTQLLRLIYELVCYTNIVLLLLLSVFWLCLMSVGYFVLYLKFLCVKTHCIGFSPSASLETYISALRTLSISLTFLSRERHCFTMLVTFMYFCCLYFHLMTACRSGARFTDNVLRFYHMIYAMTRVMMC